VGATPSSNSTVRSAPDKPTIGIEPGRSS
jgi:hypothetical protein